MHLRVRRIFRTAKSEDIEKLMILHTKTLEDFIIFKSETIKSLKKFDQRIKNKTTKALTSRFNSFQDAGGHQSFSTILVDEEGNGAILTSMYTRERTNVFAKSLKNWQSEHTLLEEEQKLIDQAIHKENVR